MTDTVSGLAQVEFQWSDSEFLAPGEVLTLTVFRRPSVRLFRFMGIYPGCYSYHCDDVTNRAIWLVASRLAGSVASRSQRVSLIVPGCLSVCMYVCLSVSTNGRPRQRTVLLLLRCCCCVSVLRGRPLVLTDIALHTDRQTSRNNKVTLCERSPPFVVPFRRR